ncbi:2-succinyl-6-hydroxy-2,4-cyclohexadiene-1-carboxylate synthase [Oceanobacillus salinisoli]|uniref:2-succinyl-6-hydroxy-2, 4-cyclohexadiene-1-carboxylate synthase n=1 Tax=Oceanobacillus salinisoli TaxID=2678611 RepID=UPI001E2BAA2F|nr:2-succinyl-6-hydroxy-2,4-cyclohexadiene-1-carboxylate synthase [Oceanobacillus salinisoli]
MYYSINDAMYWYEVHGEGVPVVLLHGFTGSTSTWKNFTKFAEGFRLITVDLPGHGKTKIHTPRNMEECCNDIELLFRSIGLDSFHLLGYSMGGRTALSYAIMHPGGVRSLILESASPGLSEEKDRNKRIKNDEQLAKKIEKEGIRAFVDFWGNIPMFASQKELSPEVQQEIRQERLSQSEEGLSMSLRYMGTGKQPSWWEHLPSMRIPVLLLVGERDEKFIQINKKMQKLLISCKLKICEQAGHAVHVEKPDIFGKLVTSFMKDNT